MRQQWWASRAKTSRSRSGVLRVAALTALGTVPGCFVAAQTTADPTSTVYPTSASAATALATASANRLLSQRNTWTVPQLEELWENGPTKDIRTLPTFPQTQMGRRTTVRLRTGVLRSMRRW